MDRGAWREGLQSIGLQKSDTTEVTAAGTAAA